MSTNYAQYCVVTILMFFPHKIIYNKISVIPLWEKTKEYVVNDCLGWSIIFLTPTYPFVSNKINGYGCIIKRYPEEDPDGD